MEPLPTIPTEPPSSCRLEDSEGRASKNAQISAYYAQYAPVYDEDVACQPFYHTVKKVVACHDWSGSILDLGCGTGLLGSLLHDKEESQQHPTAANTMATTRIVGVDLSPDMINSDAIRRYYEAPVKVTSLQQAVAESGLQFDHVASFGALMYLDADDFAFVLPRMLGVAQKSVTFDLEDTPAIYQTIMATKYPDAPAAHNHTPYWLSFAIPDGWNVVYNEYGPCYYDSLESGLQFNSTVVRLERVQHGSVD